MSVWPPIPKELGDATGRLGKPAAFTLIELLVVIGIIGILTAILLPALVNAKAQGEKLVCLSNQRQLMLATLMYAGDFDDRFPNNFGADETRLTVEQRRYRNWVNNVMTWELEPENTNRTLLLTGGIGPYVSSGTELYRCPQDTALSDIQRTEGWRQRVRSVSMNAMIGNAGEFATNGANVNNPHYTQFFSVSQVPEPARIFVFIEEHPDSINDGYFVNRFYSHEWNDLPASYHRGGANLAYADGHAASHPWLNAATQRPARPDGANLPFAVEEDAEADFYWLLDHTSVKHTY